MKRPVFILLFILILGGLSWYLRQRHLEAGAQSPPVFHGNVDIRDVRLGFRVGGKIHAVLKEEGDPVLAGDVLASLDDVPYRHAVDRALAQVARQKARLEELRNGSRPEEVAQARAHLAATEATLENSRLLFTRQQRLLRTGAVSRQDFDSAQAAFLSARANRDQARASLTLLLAGTRREQLVQAEAGLAEARAALAVAQTQLADTRLVAPESGVLLTRAVEPGSLVQVGSTAMTVSLDSPLWVRAYAPEPRLGLIHPGRRVLVFTDSRAQPYHGQIGDVSPRAEFTPKSVETTELRTALVYRFRVVVHDADSGLRQGMPVTVQLDME